MRALWSHLSFGLIPSLILLVSLSGCAESPGDSAFLGIYQVTSWTETEDSCDGEATSILEEETQSNPLVLVDACSFSIPGFGSESWIAVSGCSDEDDCEEKKCEGNSISFSFGDFGALAHGSDDDGWTNEPAWGATTQNQDPLECKMSVTYPKLYQNGEGVLTFEKRRYEGNYDPINGSCLASSFEDGEWIDHFDDSKLDDVAKDIGQNGDCVALTVVTFGPLNPGE
jgi:hypothetical protein